MSKLSGHGDRTQRKKKEEYTRYVIVSDILCVIYSCFGVTYSVLAVMYDLKFLEHKFYLFLSICNFYFMMDSGKYLRTYSTDNPNHVWKWPFSMDFIHVYLFGKYMHLCQ